MARFEDDQLGWHPTRGHSAGRGSYHFLFWFTQGLRIAPPQAPVTGYMFGKGVYFADMVSKSANYCFASLSAETGLLMLCEVALGKS